MERKHIVIVIVGFVLLLATFTNPGTKEHQHAVKQLMAQAFQKAASETAEQSENDWEKAGAALGLVLGGALVDRISETTISRTNFLLFSTTEFTWNEETRTIGMGIFGNVFISDQLKNRILRGQEK
jgi:hypothetical protein